MKKRVLIATIGAAVLVLAVSLVVLLRYLENRQYEKEAAKLITKIEEFREEHNRLPSGVSELGLVEGMGEGPYYEKTDSVDYVVYFNIGFDNVKTYSSKTKVWTDAP